MKNRVSSVIFSAIFAGIAAAGLVAAGLAAQAPAAAPAQHGPEALAHRATAKAAAGSEYPGLLGTVCPEPRAATAGAGTAGRGGAGANAAVATPAAPAGAPAAARGGAPRPSPARDTWHAEPVKVFDNLYWLGQTEYSVWAVTTPDGIIVIDTIFDYSVEDEVVEGLRKLGLDPATIKYAIVSHGHGDHSGGAKYLQDHFGTHVLMSEADWDLLDRSRGTKPSRDMLVKDGQTLTLGGTTLTMHLTPGHTPGTISTIIPVTDRGQRHVVAASGGTAFNFTITPDKDRRYWFNTYIASAEHMRDVAARAGADVIITNHTNFDGSKIKLPKTLARKAGEPNAYVVGADSVRRYFTVMAECAKAGLADLDGK